MAKFYKAALAVLFVILVLVAVIVVTGVLDVNRGIEDGVSTDANTDNSTVYTDFFSVDTSAALPLMKTDDKNIFFTMTQSGDVRFYNVSGGVITQIPEKGSFEIKANCSSQELPAVIHYIETDDGKFIGYGLFTNIMYPDVFLYDYAFFKVTNMFSAKADDKGTLLLLADVDLNRFYSDEKVYSEEFYLYADHTTDYFLSESQRTIDINARAKTDYKMFTDDILDQGEADNVLFFSSRYYVAYEESGKADIFTSGGVGNDVNTDNFRHVTDIASLNFWRYNGDTYYFQNNEDGITFSLFAYNGSESRGIATFAGDIHKDYIIEGRYLFNKEKGEIYDVLSNTTKTVSYGGFKENFVPDMFTVSENGRYVILRGANFNNDAAIGVFDLESGTNRCYTDEVFGYVANMQALDDGTAVVSLANGESATAFYQLTARIS